MSTAPLQADPASIAQLLDEHHLVVLGDPDRRRRLATTVSRALRSLQNTLVVEIGGSGVLETPALLGQLADGLDCPLAADRGLTGLAETLRRLPSRWQRLYVLWSDADAALEADPDAFGRFVNIALGIAAEREHLSRDTLVLERWLFLGGPKLGAYAQDDRGQFRAWLDEDGATPFWDVAAVVERPRVMTLRLDG